MPSASVPKASRRFVARGRAPADAWRAKRELLCLELCEPCAERRSIIIMRRSLLALLGGESLAAPAPRPRRRARLDQRLVTDLPDDVTGKICEFCDTQDQFFLVMTCKAWWFTITGLCVLVQEFFLRLATKPPRRSAAKKKQKQRARSVAAKKRRSKKKKAKAGPKRKRGGQPGNTNTRRVLVHRFDPKTGKKMGKSTPKKGIAVMWLKYPKGYKGKALAALRPAEAVNGVWAVRALGEGQTPENVGNRRTGELMYFREG